MKGKLKKLQVNKLIVLLKVNKSGPLKPASPLKKKTS